MNVQGDTYKTYKKVCTYVFTLATFNKQDQINFLEE